MLKTQEVIREKFVKFADIIQFKQNEQQELGSKTMVLKTSG